MLSEKIQHSLLGSDRKGSTTLPGRLSFGGSGQDLRCAVSSKPDPNLSLKSFTLTNMEEWTKCPDPVFKDLKNSFWSLQGEH